MHVALLRGINVGGKHRLPMKDLTEIFAEAGCRDVRTYIQSGNVIFNAPTATVKRLPKVITEKIAARFGFHVPIVLRTSEQIAQIIQNNPFLQAGEPEKTLHVLFLADVPTPEAAASLDRKRASPDRFHVVQGDVYLHLPTGVADTKLTNAYFDSRLLTKSTGRKLGDRS